jgi:hypothetical protein
MALSFVGTNSTQSTASTFTLSQPSDTAIGDLLVVAIEVESGTSNLGTPNPDVWEFLVNANQGSNQGIRVYWRFADTAGTVSYTFATGGKKTSAGMIVYRGADESDPIEVFDSAVGTTGNMVAPSVTNGRENSVLLAFFGSKKGSANHAAPSGMTLRYLTSNTDFRSSGHSEDIAEIGNTGTRTSGTSDSDSWSAVSLLIYNEADKPPPPPPGEGKVFYYEESVGVSNRNTTTDATKVTLAYTPNANKRYLYIWSAQVKSNSTSLNVRFNLKNGNTTLAQGRIEDKDTNDWHPVSGVIVEEFGATPTEQTLTLNWSASSTNNTGIREARITVIELGPNDVFVNNSNDQTNTTTTFNTAVTLNWTPPTAGDYVLIGSNEYRFTAAGETITRIVHNSTVYGESRTRRQDVLDYHAGSHAVYLPNLSGSQTATMEWARSATTTGTAHCRNAWLVAFRVDDFRGAWHGDNRTRATTTSNAFQTRVDVSTTASTTYPSLIIASCFRDHNSTSNFAITDIAESSTALISSTSQESVIASAVIGVPMGMWGQALVKVPSSENSSYQLRWRSSANGTSTGISHAQVIILQLQEEPASVSLNGNFLLFF